MYRLRRSVSFIYDQLPWLPHFTKHVPAVGRELLKLRGAAINRATERYKRGATSRDLFYYLVRLTRITFRSSPAYPNRNQSNEDGAAKETPSQEVVIADAVLALIAGADSTSITLSIAYWFLMRYPDTYDRLREEVDKYYPSGSDALDTQYHSKMVYLDAVM